MFAATASMIGIGADGENVSGKGEVGAALKGLVKRVARGTPGVRGLVEARDALHDLGEARDAFRFAPPGHFLSPIPSLKDVRRDEERLFRRPNELAGIELNEARQLELLKRFRTYYAELPFPENQTSGYRYFFDNPMYSYSDAIFLYCMLRHLRPRRVIEVGSGYSSCVTLDTNERFFRNELACTFIEPAPAVLLSLITAEDRERVEIIEKRVQDVDVSKFMQLEENDVLFIDSTHVSKIGSDVNYIFSEVLPSLSRGVYVHFHDVFFPFEYPRDWIYQGRVWSEAYLLRAFLTFNSAFEIVLFNTYLEHFHREEFERHMPLCLRNEGASIWLRRVA
jgi:hypothetical protein